MSTDLMNISAFKGQAPAEAFKVLDPQAESLADGIGSSYGIVGYKGKVWSLRLRGETHIFTRPDDGSPAAYLDVIILRQLPNKSKSYYPVNTYQDGQIGTRPVCSALDGLVPDADIVTPQSASCALCPKNVFKVSPDGRKTRECSDYKRLAVLILPTQTRALLGAALMEPVFLRVPAASLNDLAMLGEGMTAQGFHFSSYITRIGFNPDKPHPQMTFRALQGLTNREAPLVLPLRDDPLASRITGETEIGKPRAIVTATIAQPPATTAPTAAPAPVTNVVHMNPPHQNHPAAAPAPVQQAAAQPSGPVDTGFGADEPGTVTATVNPQTPMAEPTTDAGLFGTDGTAPSIQAAPTVNTASDTGAPEEADADLDARVAALLSQ